MDLLEQLEGSTELAVSNENDAKPSENSSLDYHTEIPYYVYQNRNPFLRLYDEGYYENSKFNRWTETRFFAAE